MSRGIVWANFAARCKNTKPILMLSWTKLYNYIHISSMVYPSYIQPVSIQIGWTGWAPLKHQHSQLWHNNPPTRPVEHLTHEGGLMYLTCTCFDHSSLIRNARKQNSTERNEKNCCLRGIELPSLDCWSSVLPLHQSWDLSGWNRLMFNTWYFPHRLSALPALAAQSNLSEDDCFIMKHWWLHTESTSPWLRSG